MTNFTPTKMTNEELFKSVFPLGGFEIEVFGDNAYIRNGDEAATHYFYNKKENNKFGLFLDCLHRMGIKNPTVELTKGLDFVFCAARRSLLNGDFNKQSDIPSVVKIIPFDEYVKTRITTFDQRCFIFEYMKNVAYDKINIVQDEDGNLVLKKTIGFIEPQGYETTVS